MYSFPSAVLYPSVTDFLAFFLVYYTQFISKAFRPEAKFCPKIRQKISATIFAENNRAPTGSWAPVTQYLLYTQLLDMK